MKFDAKLITVNGISCIIDGKPYNVSTEHPKYKEIEKTLRGYDATKFIELYSTKQPTHVNKHNFACTESVCVGEYEVTYKGEPIHNTVTERLIKLNEEGHDVLPLSKFLEKALSLSSENLEALFGFMENKGLPITEDGDVLGWKVVRSDFKDKYSGTIDNTPGSIIKEIPRALCDSSRVACSRGYHIGNLRYSGPEGHYYNNGDKRIIVKFNPKNVVSTPEDTSEDKLRVTVYEVISEYTEMLPDTFVNISLKDIKPGDKIFFTITEGSRISKDYEVILKYEGVSQRSKNTRFYGRLLKGTEYGQAGHSASFLISEISNLKKL